LNTVARCSVLPFSWRGSQTPPDMSSTYSTPRHSTAMPLQVEMEEGPRSKAVRVRGLQYCQYSQKKISLITLLSDHVYVMFEIMLLFAPLLRCFWLSLYSLDILRSFWRPFLLRRLRGTVEPLLSGLMTGCRWPDNKKSRIIEDNLKTTC
jgi:hypothetical protein